MNEGYIMNDLIDRKAAIDALAKHEKSQGHNYYLTLWQTEDSTKELKCVYNKLYSIFKFNI